MIEIKIPTVGESINEVDLSKWLVKSGDFVNKNQDIAEIDSDKATLTITASENGIIEIIKEEGEKAKIGEIIAKINISNQEISRPEISIELDVKNSINPEKLENLDDPTNKIKITPLAKNIINATEFDYTSFLNSENENKITKNDLLKLIDKHISNTKSHIEIGNNNLRNEEKLKLSPLRKKLAERLVAVKNQTAMLTTFNEVDMSKVIDIRNKYKNIFLNKHQVKLGFVSFFAKACINAIKLFPQINSSINGEHLIIPKYCDLAIAVSTPKGLVVPIIRNAEQLSIAELEIEISKLANKARENKITPDEMNGGTFTITNGGIFGSMMSTPILNPPQCAILGMHKITERAVVIDGKIEIKPMMYIALSYDHRIIDGRESVGFITKVKDLIENPINLLIENGNAIETLLSL